MYKIKVWNINSDNIELDMHGAIYSVNPPLLSVSRDSRY